MQIAFFSAESRSGWESGSSDSLFCLRFSGVFHFLGGEHLQVKRQ